MTEDSRLYSPSTARNRDPIRDVLKDVLPAGGLVPPAHGVVPPPGGLVLPAHGLVLEVASGAGEHAVHLAEAFPHLIFQPSDPGAAARHSIAAWIAASGLGNIRPPLDLDIALDGDRVAGLEAADAVLCINMIHISPWPATLGLMRRAAALLPAGAPLYLYGPYKRAGRHTADSNADFDASLRARDAQWGVRDLEAVAEAAAAAGFSPPRVIEMPANNLSVIFRRRATSA